jgi:hypothetical protein
MEFEAWMPKSFVTSLHLSGPERGEAAGIVKNCEEKK